MFSDAHGAGRNAPADPLAIELHRLDGLFAQYLSTLRAGGRSPLGDAGGGAVIEDGEAEGLLASLHDTHTDTVAPTDSPSETWISPLPGLERAREVSGIDSE